MAQRRTTRDLAEDSIREKVLSGDLEPGDRLNEVAIAEELQISRGPLREAIMGLTREGLLEYRPHHGAYVREPGETELAELYEVRIALETHALRLLQAEEGEWPARLADMLERSSAALDGDGTYPREMDFHASLLEATGVGMLIQWWRDLQTKLSYVRQRSSRETVRAEEALAEHQRILEHLRGGDLAAAEAEMDAHLRRSLAHAVDRH